MIGRVFRNVSHETSYSKPDSPSFLLHRSRSRSSTRHEMASVETPVLERIRPLLVHSEGDDRPIVLATCGIAGSGKSTLAKAVIGEFPNFTRLSIDEIIFERHGLYGVDYAADTELHEQYSIEADNIYLETFQRLLKEKRDVVIDRAFYAKEDRDEYRKMVDEANGRLVLVYFTTADKEGLWKRICDRSAKTRDANSALDISRETFDRYWAGFQAPSGEGEIVVEIFPDAGATAS